MSEAQAVTLTYEDGTRAVELAREAVNSYVINGQREQPGSMREAFYARTGVFVRLESTRGRGSLRGCAGAYDTSEQLGHAIVDSAIAAASEDSCGLGDRTRRVVQPQHLRLHRRGHDGEQRPG